MISSSALFTAIPKPQDRGAFMSINSSVQQLAGGIAAWVAGKIVVQDVSSKKLLHYPTLGYVVLASMLITVVLMYFLNKRVSKVKSRTFEVPQA
jgi:predicted MFS family arabinose efflux permease